MAERAGTQHVGPGGAGRQILLTAIGALNTGVGITAGAMAPDQNDQIGNIAIAILSNGSALLTPLLMEFVVDLTEGDSAGFKGWADPFCDLAGGVLVAATA